MSKEARGRLGRILLLIGRIVLGAIFLVAAYAKMKPQAGMPLSVASVKTSLAMFAMQVDSFQMLPQAGVILVAHLLPPFELFLGLWLLSGILLPFSGVVTTLLIGGFFSVVLRAYLMKMPINCGCFGPGEQVTGLTLLRDGSMFALSLGVTIGAFVVARGRKRARGRAEVSPVGTATPQRGD